MPHAPAESTAPRAPRSPGGCRGAEPQAQAAAANCSASERYSSPSAGPTSLIRTHGLTPIRTPVSVICAMLTTAAGSFSTRSLRVTTSVAAVSATPTSVPSGTVTVRWSCRMVPKLCRISPTSLRLGMITRERSACSRVVEKSAIVSTSPRTPAISMYSPTRKGLVKMMLSPATALPSTPCSAMPTPRPATPMPATSGAIWKPNLSRATTTANSMTRARTRGR